MELKLSLSERENKIISNTISGRKWNKCLNFGDDEDGETCVCGHLFSTRISYN